MMSREPRLDDTQAELLRLAAVSYVRARWIKAEQRRLYEQRSAYGEGHPARDIITGAINDLDVTRRGYDESLTEAAEGLMWTGIDVLDGTLVGFIHDQGWDL